MTANEDSKSSHHARGLLPGECDLWASYSQISMDTSGGRKATCRYQRRLRASSIDEDSWWQLMFATAMCLCTGITHIPIDYVVNFCVPILRTELKLTICRLLQLKTSPSRYVVRHNVKYMHDVFYMWSFDCWIIQGLFYLQSYSCHQSVPVVAVVSQPWVNCLLNWETLRNGTCLAYS